MLQEDDTGFFDSCQSGTPEDYAPNSGYRQRKLQFAKEVEVLDPTTGAVTGYKWVWTDDGVFFCGPINTGMKFTPLLPNCAIKAIILRIELKLAF